MNRLVEDNNVFIEKEKTDYSQARSILKEDKEKSISFINEALKKANNRVAK